MPISTGTGQAQAARDLIKTGRIPVFVGKTHQKIEHFLLPLGKSHGASLCRQQYRRTKGEIQQGGGQFSGVIIIW